MIPFLEMAAGILVALFLFRTGMPSIFPLLIWVPLLSFSPSWLFIVGLVSASLAWEAYLFYHSPSLVPTEWLIGFVVAAMGLLALVFFQNDLPILTLFIVPILALSLLGLFVRSNHAFIPLLAGISFILLVGWFGLHVWVVPFALPSLLLGFFGSVSAADSPSPIDQNAHPIRNAILGVFSGILPGLGPGIISALWFSGNSSPSLRVSNLVFSLGFVSITGSVRSFPAGILSSFALPSWEWIIAYSVVGFFLAFGLSFIFPAFTSLPLLFFFALHAFLLFLLGGFPSLVLIFLAYGVSRLVLHFRLPLSFCSLCLIPSILWFYY